ncbi:MAG: NAD(+)/NADH kinase [Tissierellia bacterium]|nr:NAD(+)/NADH kinase [Tissierellia bacterium]
MKEFINVFYNYYDQSVRVKNEITKRLEEHGIGVSETYSDRAKYNLVIGGDGTFISACHESDFSSIPFIGINTGHLGFYQEIQPENIDYAVNAIVNDNQKIQELKLIKCHVQTSLNSFSFLAVNEIVLKAKYANIIHFAMYVNDVLLQHYSGDGVILSTPSGSTAYNMSAGGSILYQTLDGFQITPIAPIRSSIFRSLDKSLVVPADTKIRLLTKKSETLHSALSIDGVMKNLGEIKYIEISMAEKVINKVIINENWYWHNIKNKLI